MLAVHNLIKDFDGLEAVSRIDFNVEKGEILGLIGPNGAGKTTIFNLITGFHKPTKGTIIFERRNITGLRPHKIAALGLVRTFQLINLFSNHTVLENILAAYHLQRKAGAVRLVIRTPFALKDEQRIRDKAKTLLEKIGLLDFRNEEALRLPHGLQKALGLGIAMATGPTMLLLDEPVSGMSSAEADHIMSVVRQVRDQGVTIMLVEHNLKAVMAACDRIVVINFGHKIAQGTPEEVAKDEKVISAYLGFEGTNKNDAQNHP